MTSIKPRTAAPIIIYQGDDMERLTELRQAVAHAERQAGAPRRGGDPDEVQEAKNAYNAFVDEAAERAVEVRLQAIGGFEFMDLLAEHPPREIVGDDGKEIHPDDDLFEMNNVNTRTFPLAILCYEEDGRRTILEPEFNSDRKREAFVKSLALGQLEELWTTAYLLNKGGSFDPKDSRFSAEPPTSTETSNSPAR